MLSWRARSTPNVPFPRGSPLSPFRPSQAVHTVGRAPSHANFCAEDNARFQFKNDSSES